MRGWMVLSLVAVVACKSREPRLDDAAAGSCEDAYLSVAQESCGNRVWLGDVQMFLRASDYQGSLAKCNQDDFGDDINVRLHLEGSRIRRTGDDPSYGHTDTVVSAKRLGPSECGVALVVSLKDRVVQLAGVTELRYIRKRVVRNFEADVSVSVAVRDDSNQLLFGSASGQRDATWDKDIFPELTLQTLERTCRIDQSELALEFELATDGKCRGGHWRESCCHVRGSAFVLRTINATRAETGTKLDSIDVVFGRTDILTAGSHQ